MLKVKYSNKFEKDYKRIKKRNYDLSKLRKVVELLANQTPLPTNYKEHNLIGDYEGFKECHIEPDWLLIYQINNNELILVLTRTGTHSDLFKK